MICRRTWRSFAALVLAGAVAGAVWAQETARPSDEQVKERLLYLENALRSGRPAARAWWYGWISVYGAGTVAQWSLAGAHWKDTKPVDGSPGAQRVRDRGFAEDMLVGGATTALGLGGLLIDPFVPAYGSNALKRLPEATPEERRTKLLRAEEILRRCAAREKNGRGLTTHLLNIGVNAAAGIVTAAAFHRPWTDGLLTFAAGEAVSLLTIFTQPRRAIRDLREYEALVRGGGGALANAPPPGRDMYFSLSPRGISLGLRF
jgi:hypothetical protein